MPDDLRQRLLRRISWRVSDLHIELHGSHATLHGRATTSYARRMAEQAAQELLPQLRLDNAIVVAYEAEVRTGMPLH
jgi:predicted house-cleaning NTP pyrophosphatase (Maf/HAM1 superfamily)